ncbi:MULTISPECIES: hypothetical protein [unclassified Micromonospora]|uniref:hypothetical protein n=1 Tax=unclassified Micromonospora TaxID=2617518 RepID=UPI00362DBEDA
MKRVGPGVLFLAWFYGVPFLFVVGLVRRVSSPYVPTPAAARAFGATTYTILTAALVLNLVLPIAGALLARLVRDGYWRRHFAWSPVGVVLIYVAVAMVGSMATGPLFRWTPAVQGTTTPTITQCIPISGGRGCPGG